MTQQESAAIVITGAINFHERSQQPARLFLLAGICAVEHGYDMVTKRVYAKLGSLASRTALVVPPNFGIMHPDKQFERTAPVISRKLSKLETDDITLVGHSMGGVIAARYANEEPDLIKSVIAISSPFEGITGSLFRHRELTANTQRIRELRADLGDEAPDLHFIASSRDLLVPRYSAIPAMPNSTFSLITRNAPDHVTIINHPEVLNICEEIING